MFARILTGLALLLLAACGEVGGACGLRMAADVPVEVRRGIPLVTVDTEAGSGQFMLDSGAGLSSTTLRGAARLKLPTIAGGAYDVSGVGGTSTGGVVVFRGARLAGLALPEDRGPLLPDGSVAGVLGSDGILGIKHLSRYEWDLDLPQRRLRLYAGTPCANEALPFPAGGVNAWSSWITRPGFDHFDPRPHIKVEVAGREMAALLDTGASSTTIFADAIDGLGLGGDGAALLGHIDVQGWGPQTQRAARYGLSSITVGGRVLRHWEVKVLARPTPADVKMVLGMDYLAKHRVWIAHSRRVVLVPGPATPP